MNISLSPARLPGNWSQPWNNPAHKNKLSFLMLQFLKGCDINVMFANLTSLHIGRFSPFLLDFKAELQIHWLHMQIEKNTFVWTAFICFTEVKGFDCDYIQSAIIKNSYTPLPPSLLPFLVMASNCRHLQEIVSTVPIILSQTVEPEASVVYYSCGAVA